MRRQIARFAHSSTNLAYWMENPDWYTGNCIADKTLGAVRKLPFSTYHMLKKCFFNTQDLLAVNGESVVVASGNNVDKFMLRYPRNLTLDAFKEGVQQETGLVTNSLGSIALPTEVSIKPASVLRGRRPVDAVVQTQPRLDLKKYIPFSLDILDKEKAQTHSVVNPDRTVRALGSFLEGVEKLIIDGYYPDVTVGSDNLRYDIISGELALIDVMPVYADGSRLIGDRPFDIIPRIQQNIAACQDVAGRYGA